MIETKNTPLENKKINNPYKIFEIRDKYLFKRKLFHKNLISPQSSITKYHCISPDVSKIMKKITLSSLRYKKYIYNYDKITKENSFKTPDKTQYPHIKNMQYIPILYSYRKRNDNFILKKKKLYYDNIKLNTNITNSLIISDNNGTNYKNLSIDNSLNKEAKIEETSYGFKYKDTKIITDMKKYKEFKDNKKDNKDNKEHNKNYKDNNYKKINNINTFKYKYYKFYRSKDKEKEVETNNNNFFYNLSDGNFFENKNNNNNNLNNNNSNENETCFNNYYDIKYTKNENKEFNLRKEKNILFLLEEIKKISNIHNFNNKYNQKIDFSIKSQFKKNISFILEIKSLYLEFIEISPEHNFDKIKKQKIYFPFYYLIFFYLLDFISFKCLISEIIIYDTKQNLFKINYNDEFKILNKYSENAKFYFENFSKIKSNNNFDLFNDITYNLNENKYNINYDWCIYDGNNNLSSKLFKMKIVLPKIKLSLNEHKIKFNKFIHKNLMIELLKKDFQNWNKYILFDLFIHKKFRLIVNNILLHKFDLYKNRKLYIDNHNEYNNKNNHYINKNYEFYITNIKLNVTKFFYFIPNTVILTSLSNSKEIKINYIQLSIKDTNNIKKLSKCLGIYNILLKCLDINKNTNEIILNMNLIENITDDFINIVENENSIKNINIKNNNDENEVFQYKYNDKEINMMLRNPKIINIIIKKKKIDLLYYDLPEILLEDILKNNSNDHIKYLYNSIHEIDLNIEKLDENNYYVNNKETIYFTNGESLTKKEFEKKLFNKNKRGSIFGNLLIGKLNKNFNLAKNYAKLFGKQMKSNIKNNLFNSNNFQKFQNNMKVEYTPKK